MAKCPACGKKLHLYNWKPNCPACGVNLNYYKSNEGLLDESEKSEIEHSKFQPKVDRAKAATVGTTIGKIRMATFLVPIAALFLPLFSITVSGDKKNFNALGIYELFSAVDTGALFNHISPLLLAIIFLAVPAVCCIVFTIMQIAAGTKKGLKKNIILSSLSFALVAASCGCILAFAKNPADAYTDLLLNESAYAVSSGDQGAVDSAVQKIRNMMGSEGVDQAILIHALENGETMLASSVDYGHTEEELTALQDAIAKGKEVLNNTEASIDDVRDAANGVNGANYAYSKLQTTIYAVVNDQIAVRDETGDNTAEYSDEALASLNDAIKEAREYLALAVERAKRFENNDTYSENSFNDLQSAIEDCETKLETLNKGELIVELLDDDGSGDKTEKEIAQETAESLNNSFNNLNGKIAGLVDITVITPFSEGLSIAKEQGALNEVGADNISAGVGIGVLVLLLLYAAQIVFHVIILKKGFEVKYTECLIGGLPSDEYFAMVEQGMTKEQIRRKMLVRLAKMQDEARLAQEEAERKAEEEKIEEIKERLAEKEHKEEVKK